MTISRLPVVRLLVNAAAPSFLEVTSVVTRLFSGVTSAILAGRLPVFSATV